MVEADTLERPAAEAPPPLKKRKRRPFEYTRIPCYDKQTEAIFNPVDMNGDPARYSWIEASTKAGKTRGCIAWLFEMAMIHGKPGRNYWWIAPVYVQAEIAYKRMKRGIKKFILKTNDTEKSITLLNGAVMHFKTGEKPDNLYGEDVYAVVIDEASRTRPAVWTAIRTTLTATGGPVRAIGNVKGRKNWFYEMCRLAEHGRAKHAYYKMTAADAVKAGVFSQEEVDDAQGTLSDAEFRELYYAEPADDGGNPFGLMDIQACIGPMSDEAPFAIGVDFAKSKDWTVVHALDRLGRTCGFERWQTPWSITTPKVASLCGGTPTLADRTGVGDPIVEELQRTCNYMEGFLFTRQSKQELMVGLAAAIQKREVVIPNIKVLIDELESFEYEYTPTGVRYSAPEGMHDDTVIALALAVEQRRRLNPNVEGALPRGDVTASVWLTEAEEL